MNNKLFDRNIMLFRTTATLVLVCFSLILLPGCRIADSAEIGHYLSITSENKSDQAKLYYQDIGTGDPIIFIPGWTMTTEMFEHQIAHYSQNYRVITFDPRGQGRSSKTTEGNNYVQHARDLKQLIDKLHVINPVLISWSWGIVEHLAYINLFGHENIKASVFIDGSPKSLIESPEEWGDGTLHEDLFWPRTAMYDREQLNIIFTDWMLEDNTSQTVKNWVIEQSLKTPNYIASLLAYDAVFTDYTPDIIALDQTHPILYVLREEWSESAKNWIANNTPNADVFVLGKHMMFWQHPQQFNQRLDEFLEKVDK